jgi:sensor domain CHASE-containing protein
MNLTAGGVTLAGVILLSVILYAAWAANSSASAREIALFGNAVNRSILRILNEQKSVAWWDEAYTAVTSAEPNTEFLESEFGIFLSETYGHDIVVILNPENVPIFMYSGGARRSADDFDRYRTVFAPVLAEIRQVKGRSLRKRPDLFGAENYRTIGSPLQTARWTGHLLTVDGAPAAVGALTILPNINTGLLKPGRPHVLVSVNMIDEAYLQEQGRSLLLKDLTLGKTANTGSEYAGMPLETDDGKIAGWVNWKTEQPGNSLTSIILPLVAAGFVAAAVQAWIMLQRLRNTSSHLAQQEKRSRYAAKHDALSGLPNRAHFAEHLGMVLADIDPDGMGQTAVIAYLDVDRFKEVNDTLATRLAIP